jgi:polar amino acid transport system substrate-binding protein
MRTCRRACAVGLASVLGVLPLLPPDARAGLLDDIKKRGEIVVATEAAFAPFEFVENGKIVGYGADLLALLMKDLTAQGVKVKQLDLPWQGVLPGLLAKKYDMVATSVVVTEERVKRFAFTVPIAEATLAIAARKDDSGIQKPEDIVGKVVGTQQASAPLGGLKVFNEQLTKTKGAGVKEIKEYIGFPELYVDLANGRVEAVANGLPNLAVLAKQQPDKYKVVGTFGDKAYFSWVTRQPDKDLLKYLNDRLIKLKQDGTMKELQQKWFGFVMETPNAGFKPLVTK